MNTGQRPNFLIMRVCGLAFVLIGALYPQSNDIIQRAFRLMLGDVIFTVWCVVVFLCGFGLIIRPRFAPLLLSPFLLLLIPLGLLALTGISGSAAIYYSALYPLAVFLWADEIGHTFKWMSSALFAVVLNIAMLAVLLGIPNGAGMELFYHFVLLWLPDSIPPERVYQLGYGISAIGYLFIWRGWAQRLNLPSDYVAKMILTMPFIVHSVTFFMISAFVAERWAYPFTFACIALLWLATMAKPQTGANNAT